MTLLLFQYKMLITDFLQEKSSKTIFAKNVDLKFVYLVINVL